MNLTTDKLKEELEALREEILITAEKGLELEWELYPECIQLFAQRRLKKVRMTYQLENGKTAERAVIKIIDKKDKNR